MEVDITRSGTDVRKSNIREEINHVDTQERYNAKHMNNILHLVAIASWSISIREGIQTQRVAYPPSRLQ